MTSALTKSMLVTKHTDGDQAKRILKMTDRVEIHWRRFVGQRNSKRCKIFWLNREAEIFEEFASYLQTGGSHLS